MKEFAYVSYEGHSRRNGQSIHSNVAIPCEVDWSDPKTKGERGWDEMEYSLSVTSQKSTRNLIPEWRPLISDTLNQALTEWINESN